MYRYYKGSAVPEGEGTRRVGRFNKLQNYPSLQGKVSLSGLKSDLSDEVYSASLTLSDGRRVREASRSSHHYMMRKSVCVWKNNSPRKLKLAYSTF